MKTALIALLLITGTAMAGTVYKWIDPATGKTVFSDLPPPSNVKAQETKLKASVIETGGPSYEMREAMKNAPVTLYTSECGEICNEAKKLLSSRSVPYTLKNPATQPAFLDELRKLANGDAPIPVLVVGSQVLKGFQQGPWNSALDSAGYPKGTEPSRPKTEKTAGAPATNPAATGKPPAKQEKKY